jgi:hypothetical protein
MGWIWLDQALSLPKRDPLAVDWLNPAAVPITVTPEMLDQMDRPVAVEEGKRIGFCGFARLGRHD